MAVTSGTGAPRASRLAIYPGSFDPPHLGHMNIIERSLAVFDRVVVAVVENPGKRSLFTPQERIEMIQQSLGPRPNLVLDQFEGLLVDYVRARRAHVVIRGLRAVQDFEYELQMAGMNRKLAPEIDTLFMMTDESWSYVSSRLIKEVSALGGDVSTLVPEPVLPRLRERLGGTSAAAPGASRPPTEPAG